MTDGAAQVIASLDAAIARYGQTVIVQRTATDPSTGEITVSEQVTCPARVRAVAPQDLEAEKAKKDVFARYRSTPAPSRIRSGANQRHDIRVVVSSSALGSFGIPARDDRILINDRASNVEEIAPLYYAGRLVRLNMLCRG
jgi:hypothetical protein